MEVAMAEAVRLRPYRLRPHKENYIRGSDMVTLMSGKWNELWKIKTGEIISVFKNDIGEKFDVLSRNPKVADKLNKILEEWLISTNAKIPKVDPIYNKEKETKWLSLHKIKIKEKVEKRRKDELKLDYKPNIDWWGSSLE